MLLACSRTLAQFGVLPKPSHRAGVDLADAALIDAELPPICFMVHPSKWYSLITLRYRGGRVWAASVIPSRNSAMCRRLLRVGPSAGSDQAQLGQSFPAA